MRISKTFTFDAAHHLPNYDGKCKNVHGHTWKVEVVVGGHKNPKTDMIVDFNILKKLFEPILEMYDHQNLNDFMDNPTAENIAENIYNSLYENMFDKGISLIEIKVWESPTSMVSYDYDDLVRDNILVKSK